MVADYRATGMTLGRHPMELLRPSLKPGTVSSADLSSIPHGRWVTVAGMVVARQRPATAKGVVFMLLEDEHGMANLVVPPPVAERCRMAIRTAGFVLASGKLEHREGTINVVLTSIERLERPSQPPTEVRQIAPPVPRETGRRDPDRERAVSELEAALPAGHSFGRRGR
jgi:error-prone DNA polymerase